MRNRHYLNKGSSKGQRKLFNIHTATLAMERSQLPIKRTSSNVEMICLSCNHKFYSVIAYYVSCPICRNRHKAEWGINIRPSELTDEQLKIEGNTKIFISYK